MLIESCCFWAWKGEMDKDALPKWSFAPGSRLSCLVSCALCVSLRPGILWRFVDQLYSELNPAAISAGCRVNAPLSLPSSMCVKSLPLPHLLLPADAAIPDVLSLPCFRSHTIHRGRIADRMCGTMSNSSSLRAPNLLFGCCCYLTTLPTQARGLLGRRADTLGESEVTTMPTTMIPFEENLGLWRIKDR